MSLERIKAEMGRFMPACIMEALMPEDDPPPAALDCEVNLLSYDPLLGVLVLETDEGELKLAINRPAAALIGLAMVDFLAAEAEDNPEKMD